MIVYNDHFTTDTIKVSTMLFTRKLWVSICQSVSESSDKEIFETRRNFQDRGVGIAYNKKIAATVGSYGERVDDPNGLTQALQGCINAASIQS